MLFMENLQRMCPLPGGKTLPACRHRVPDEGLRFRARSLGLCAQGVKTEAATAKINGDAGEACRSKASKGGAGRERREHTLVVADVVNPTIVDFEGQENAAGAKHAQDFSKGQVLQLAGLQMMKNENGNSRRESFISEGKLRSIPAENPSRVSAVLRLQFQRGLLVIFERSDASDTLAEMFGSRAIAGPNFQQVISQARAGKNPRKKLALRDVSPEGGRADVVFEGVHGARGQELKV